MAGSYRHLMDRGGGWSLIEHMGDAHEAVTELLWLVESQIGHDAAVRLLLTTFHPMARGEQRPDQAYKRVMRVMDR
jgi:hypothetical protein